MNGNNSKSAGYKDTRQKKERIFFFKIKFKNKLKKSLHDIIIIMFTRNHLIRCYSIIMYILKAFWLPNRDHSYILLQEIVEFLLL